MEQALSESVAEIERLLDKYIAPVAPEIQCLLRLFAIGWGIFMVTMAVIMLRDELGRKRKK